MAGLSNRSRPVQGVGEYLLPLEFKLAPDVNTKHKNIVAPIARKPFSLGTKLKSGSSEFVVPIIKSDFKLRPKVSEVFKVPLSPVQRKEFALHSKLLNVTQENLSPVMRSAFTLGGKIEKAPSTTIVAQPKVSSIQGIYPRTGLKGIDFEGNIYINGESEDIVFEGGSSVKSIISDVGKSSITYNINRQLELEFFINDPIKIQGFEYMFQLDSPLNTYAPSSIGIYNVESGANVNVMGVSGLSTNEPIKSYFKSLPELRHFKVIFFGRTTRTSLQYFKLF